ncbi:MAG: DUF6456 domain-containing protein [Pseudomonadota bacterium]
MAQSKEERRMLQILLPVGAFAFCAPGDRIALFGPQNQFRAPLARPTAEQLSEWRRRDWLERAQDQGSPGGRTERWRLNELGRAAVARGRDADQARARRTVRAALDGTSPASGGPPPRLSLDESPLAALARRKDANGAPWLTATEVEAGERLRADFEAAGIAPSVAQNWDRFLTVVDETGARAGRGPAGGAAADRVRSALAALGPGLSDAAFRTCCFLEGVERLERRMGWSARSGKVVLKIALARLAAHYGLGLVNERVGRIRVWRSDAVSLAEARE